MEFAIFNCSLSAPAAITCNVVSRLDFECMCHVILIRKGQPWPTSSGSRTSFKLSAESLPVLSHPPNGDFGFPGPPIYFTN